MGVFTGKGQKNNLHSNTLTTHRDDMESHRRNLEFDDRLDELEKRVEDIAQRLDERDEQGAEQESGRVSFNHYLNSIQSGIGGICPCVSTKTTSPETERRSTTEPPPTLSSRSSSSHREANPPVEITPSPESERIQDIILDDHPVEDRLVEGFSSKGEEKPKPTLFARMKKSIGVGKKGEIGDYDNEHVEGSYAGRSGHDERVRREGQQGRPTKNHQEQRQRSEQQRERNPQLHHEPSRGDIRGNAAARDSKEFSGKMPKFLNGDEPQNRHRDDGMRDRRPPNQVPGGSTQNRGIPQHDNRASQQFRGDENQMRGDAQQNRGAPLQNRGAPQQGRGAPQQGRGAPQQNSGDPLHDPQDPRRGEPDRKRGNSNDDNRRQNQSRETLGTARGNKWEGARVPEESQGRYEGEDRKIRRSQTLGSIPPGQRGDQNQSLYPTQGRNRNH